jgi:hypothetical protein
MLRDFNLSHGRKEAQKAQKDDGRSRLFFRLLCLFAAVGFVCLRYRTRMSVLFSNRDASASLSMTKGVIVLCLRGRWVARAGGAVRGFPVAG